MVLVFIPLRLYTSRPTLAIFVQSNSVGARMDDAGKGKKETGYLYKALMVARW
jgi:hypothetical protein